MELELNVGPQISSDNKIITARGDSWGGVLTNSHAGFYAEQVMRGNGYVFSTALAGNALVAATTSNAPAIWNPPGSGRLLVIVKVVFGRTAVGTPLEGHICYLRTQSVTSGPGTGCDIVSGTKVAALNLRSDLGDNSGVNFYPTTISTTPTPTFWASAGIAQTADDGATTVSGPRAEQLTDHLDGLLIVGEKTLFSIGAAVSLNTTYAISIYALSLPKPALA